MKKIIYIFLLITTYLNAENTQFVFEKAQKAYNEGKYEQAIEAYMQILKEKKHSTALYYNLANAHYKRGDVAESIYYYEKALQLSPTDEDVQNNLKFAQQLAIDKITPLPKTWFSRIGETITSWYSPDGWAVQAILFIVFFVVCFLLYYLLEEVWKKRLFFTLMILFGCISIGSFWIGNIAHTQQQNNRFGILFDKIIHVYTEPNTYSQEVFTLHEGTKVEITEHLDNWFKIKIADGKTGWIKSSTTQILYKNK